MTWLEFCDKHFVGIFLLLALWILSTPSVFSWRKKG